MDTIWLQGWIRDIWLVEETLNQFDVSYYRSRTPIKSSFKLSVSSYNLHCCSLKALNLKLIIPWRKSLHLQGQKKISPLNLWSVRSGSVRRSWRRTCGGCELAGCWLQYNTQQATSQLSSVCSRKLLNSSHDPPPNWAFSFDTDNIEFCSRSDTRDCNHKNQLNLR